VVWPRQSVAAGPGNSISAETRRWRRLRKGKGRSVRPSNRQSPALSPAIGNLIGSGHPP
jgi:hypothetical protein